MDVFYQGLESSALGADVCKLCRSEHHLKGFLQTPDITDRHLCAARKRSLVLRQLPETQSSCKTSQCWSFEPRVTSQRRLAMRLLPTLLPLLYMATRHSRWYMWPHLPSLPTSSGLMPLCCRMPSYPDAMASLSMQMVQSWNSRVKCFICRHSTRLCVHHNFHAQFEHQTAASRWAWGMCVCVCCGC